MDYEWYFDTYQLSFIFHSDISYLMKPNCIKLVFLFLEKNIERTNWVQKEHNCQYRQNILIKSLNKT